ncbi:MAG: UbiA family prenyltransferase [Balneolales bacterium]
MNIQAATGIKPGRQVLNFVIHLRWHYQVFILSGCYLLGGLFHTGPAGWPMFLLQFLNVHLLLFGGATAFNSFWDKDKGRIGGLKKPPPMASWMHPASLALQCAGLMLALPAGYEYTMVYVLSMMMFWLYSTPLAKWKGRPWLSMVAIGLSTGWCSFLLGFMAIGGSSFFPYLLPATGCSLILLSMYPVSQVFQMEEDRERGYRTFALCYGLNGIRIFFPATYIPGLLITGFTLHRLEPAAGHLFLALSVLTGTVIWWQLRRITGTEDDYKTVMRIKYLTSFAFVIFIVFWLLAGRSA